MMDALSPSRRLAILVLFWGMVAVFGFTVLTMFVDRINEVIPQALLWDAGAMFVLGTGLTALTWPAPIERWLRRCLLLTGASVIGLVLSFVLHNLMYALNTLAGSLPLLHSVLTALEVAFFLAAVIVFPITLVVGIVGVIVLLVRGGRTLHHPPAGAAPAH